MKLEIQIPELSNLRPRSAYFLMAHFFMGNGPRENPAYALVANYIRLSDFALAEYENGRTASVKFLNDNEEIGAMIRFLLALKVAFPP